MIYAGPLPESLPPPEAMHIPDGFVSAPVAGVAYVVAGVFLALAVRQANRRFQERLVPLMGVMAAFIFAAQMMNFPVAGGTSGHMIGAALATILLGPWAAMIVLACVVGVQALIFQDGGMAALGANIVNMAVVGVLVSQIVYGAARASGVNNRRFLYGAAFVAAWLSIEIASLAASAELAVSGTSPWHVVAPAMAGVHALIGIGEGLVTVAALALVSATRSDLLIWRVEKEARLEVE